MKKTSRRNFGKQLTGALAALPMATLATPIVSAQEKTQTKAHGGDLVDIRNQHDTPPPVILMSGSWIFEARTELNHIWTTTAATTLGGKPALMHKVPAYDNQNNPATKPIYIAHIKIVDGSGEMLYRLDNEDKDAIAINSYLKNDKTESAVLKTDNKDFVIVFLDDKKLENKADDPSMDPEEDVKTIPRRQRARYKNEKNKNGKIYSIEISGAKAGLLCALKLENHKAARELRIMCWWEQ